MVERFYRPKVTDEPAAPIGLLKNMFDPSMSLGRDISGGGVPAPINIGTQLDTGGKYGLTAWDDLWGEGGEITDMDALLRSMNFGSVMHSPGKRAGDAGRSGFLYMGGNDTPTNPYGYSDPLTEWLHGLGYQGVEGGSTWYGRDKRDIGGNWYNPDSLWFSGEGMDLENATQDSLNQWAMDTYGVPLKNLAAYGPDQHETMQSWYQDPTQWWNPEMRGLDVTSIPGFSAEESGNMMEAFQSSYDTNRAMKEQRMANAMMQLQGRGMMADPNMARSAEGMRLLAQAPQAMTYAQGMRRMAPSQLGYEGMMALGLEPYQTARALGNYWNQYT